MAATGQKAIHSIREGGLLITTIATNAGIAAPVTPAARAPVSPLRTKAARSGAPTARMATNKIMNPQKSAKTKMRIRANQGSPRTGAKRGLNSTLIQTAIATAPLNALQRVAWRCWESDCLRPPADRITQLR